MAKENEQVMEASEKTASSVVTKSPPVFDENHALHALRHYLPTQTPIKDFIHHNSLHAFQAMKFFDALFKASDIFGYQPTFGLRDFRKLFETGRIKSTVLERIIAERKGPSAVNHWKKCMLIDFHDENRNPEIGKIRNIWKEKAGFDLDGEVQPLLFRITGKYLDQGISRWEFPLHEQGFLASLRNLQEYSFTSFFKTSEGKKVFLDRNQTIHSLLTRIVGDESYFERYLFDQQFTHRGWSGMVAAVEGQPDTLLDRRIISLKDFILFELVLELDVLCSLEGVNFKPLSHYGLPPFRDLFEDSTKTLHQEVLELWQRAFEWSYYDEVLAGFRQAESLPVKEIRKPAFQAMFCIDERECSIRRHIESVEPDCETLGTPGFFGVEFYFRPEGGKFYDKLCPAPVTPKYLIKESKGKQHRKPEWIYHPIGNTLVGGFFFTIVAGPLALIKSCLDLFRPAMTAAISDAFAHMDPEGELTIENKNPEDRENNLQVGFTIAEMATRVEGLLRSTGLTVNFADLVYLIAHGSSSANNPHHGAHDCGACSGRPGSVNSRVMAFMANHPEVRAILNSKGITIPEKTKFVGALHDTAADQIKFFGTSGLSPESLKQHKIWELKFEEALDLNAKERSRRFASIPTRNPIKNVRERIRQRSVSLFEPRPELGHGTNSLCIVGSRNLTRKLFLDRRAFLNSYDYRQDPSGQLLTGVMRPLGPVCGGINLEYYFSRVDNYRLGAGTKLPHHVMGLYGVTNSADGDLRPGLPLQMIEVHDPVRLLIVVEHFPEVVLNSIQSTPEMYEWYINEWVHLVVIHPETHQFHYFSEGRFSLYKPITAEVSKTANPISVFEQSIEMETNYIVDATKENLPVMILD